MRKGPFLISVFVATALVSGCGVHNIRKTDVAPEMPRAFAGAEDASPAEEAGRWWKKFNDEKLNAIMDEAFANNLDIARAVERLAQTEAVYRATGAAGYPQVDAAAKGGRSRASGVTADNYRLSAAASFEIDLWRKISSRTKAAKLDASASKEDIRSLYISISAELADLYYLAVEQRAQLELTDRTIEAFEDTLTRVERRYREGLVPALDLYQARQNLALAKSQRPVFEASLDTTLHAVSVLSGRFPGKELSGQTTELPEAPDFAVGLPSRLLTGRPDLRGALLRVEASDQRVAAAIADRFPSFNLIGEYGGASAVLGSILDSPNVFWNALLQAALPVIDGGRRKAEAQRAEAAYREALLGYRQAVLTSFREVEDALSSGKASKGRIGMLKERVDASESALRLALDRYLAGLSDYLPVLTEQQRLYEAQSTLLSARRQFISNRIALARSLGGEWADEAAAKYATAGKDEKR